MNYYNQSVAEVLSHLQTDKNGYSNARAEELSNRYGPNSLQTSSSINRLLLFVDQFKNFIIYILLFAVGFSLLIGEYVDSFLILAILTANALIGYFQELSAHRSLEALKKLSAVQATVIRDNERQVIDAALLVAGDIIHLEAGDKVPADARIIEATRLGVEEASLTGESLPVEKNSASIKKQVQLGEQRNMLFSSTSVVAGHCLAVVVAIGMDTEIGKITSLITGAKDEMTPLQMRLHFFGQKLGTVILLICTVVFLLLAGKAYLDETLAMESFVAFLFIAISLAVAAVPTALPAVVTIALSIGVRRLLEKKALVRKLSSVETLGSCDVICTDKTGTLTENQMTVRYGWSLDGEAHFEGVGYAPVGNISGDITPHLFAAGLLCNNSSVQEKDGEWQMLGDPTEAALLVSAGKVGVQLEHQRLDEIPFDSDRKRMSVRVELDDGFAKIITKGAPDQILAVCTHVSIDGCIELLDEDRRRLIAQKNDEYAHQAMRVLAFAEKEVQSEDQFQESGLVFIGLQAMSDPPREDVREAIARTVKAGIRVIMVTGDYQATAVAIGREIGIEGKVCSGEQLEKMSDNELIHALERETNIFARVVPEHKQRIITALQDMQHTVAMTGDGVNDAPALKKANIGIAVGSGTEVAKEASDFVLLDNSFTHIVNAIEEGRGIYDNIQKSIMLLLSGNLGEVLIIFLAIILGMNLPLTAILLLWINMVTDGAPALAFSVDPYGTDTMSRKPKEKGENILPLDKLRLIATLGCAGTLFALGLFSLYGGGSDDPEALMQARTMVFNFVVLYEVILIFVIRASYNVPLWTNGWVWASAGGSIALQLMLMYTPLRTVFKISALQVGQLGALLLAAVGFYLLARLYQGMVARRG